MLTYTPIEWFRAEEVLPELGEAYAVDCLITHEFPRGKLHVSVAQYRKRWKRKPEWMRMGKDVTWGVVYWAHLPPPPSFPSGPGA